MRGDFSRDLDTTRFGPPNDVDRPGSGHVTHVKARTHMMGEQNITSDDRFFGHRRPSRQAQHTAECTLVHLCTLGEPWLLGMLRDDTVECLDILQSTSHQCRVPNAFAIVTEHSHLRRRRSHRTQFGQLHASKAYGHGPNRMHVDKSGLAP